MSDARSILIADDNGDVRDALAIALREEGYRVRAARDAYEARRLFAATHPDLLLSDIRMPGDGLSLLRQVHDMSPGTPVILMTAFERPGDRSQAIEGGATDFLVKPVVGDRLRAALRRAFDGDRSDASE
jgi:DNA-binding NtrC family response regulator